MSIPVGYETGEVAFSADGRHVAVVGIKEGKAAVFVDSVEIGNYDAAKHLVFRNGGRDYGFVARKDGREVAVVNGVQGTLYESVSKPFFAPDGRIVYAARLNDKWVIISGKQVSFSFDSTNPGPVVGSDGKMLAFTELRSDTQKYSLRVCTIEMKECVKGKDYDSLSDILSDMSSLRHVYIARKGGKKAVVEVAFAEPGLNEKEGRWYDEVSMAGFSDTGAHLAYLARTEGKTSLVRDGIEKPIERHGTVFEMAVSNDGRTLYSTMADGKVVAFVDGKKTGEEYNGIYAPRFSPDGSNYVFAADKGDRSVVIINGQETPSFDKTVIPKFSPDGSKIVYRARNKGERFVVVADLQGKTVREHPHYEAVWDVSFSPDGKLVGYGVKIGNELWWKVEKLEN
jgi:Tol biopolymer transport system component